MNQKHLLLQVDLEETMMMDHTFIVLIMEDALINNADAYKDLQALIALFKRA
jgi:hypothetical protein